MEDRPLSTCPHSAFQTNKSLKVRASWEAAPVPSAGHGHACPGPALLGRRGFCFSQLWPEAAGVWARLDASRAKAVFSSVPQALGATDSRRRRPGLTFCDFLSGGARVESRPHLGPEGQGGLGPGPRGLLVSVLDRGVWLLGDSPTGGLLRTRPPPGTQRARSRHQGELLPGTVAGPRTGGPPESQVRETEVLGFQVLGSGAHPMNECGSARRAGERFPAAASHQF